MFIQKYWLACCWANWAQQAVDWGFAPTPFHANTFINCARRREGAWRLMVCAALKHGDSVVAGAKISAQLDPQNSLLYHHPGSISPCTRNTVHVSPVCAKQSFFSLGFTEASKTCQRLMKPHFHWLAPLKIFHLSVPRFKYFPLAGSQVCPVDYVARQFTLAVTML